MKGRFLDFEGYFVERLCGAESFANIFYQNDGLAINYFALIYSFIQTHVAPRAHR